MIFYVDVLILPERWFNFDADVLIETVMVKMLFMMPRFSRTDYLNANVNALVLSDRCRCL